MVRSNLQESTGIPPGNIHEIIKRLEDFRKRFLQRVARWRDRRKIPRNLRDAVLLSWKQRCAICGRKDGERYRENSSCVSLAIAHIVPVEEGGDLEPITEGRRVVGSTNLIPLCERACRSLWEAREKRKAIDDVGCHHLFDNEGAWTRQQIRELLRSRSRNRTGVGRPSVRSGALPEPDQVEALKERVEQKISWPSKGRNPLPKIRAKLDSKELKWDQRLGLAICGLRLARRPFPGNPLSKLHHEVNFFQNELSKLEREAQLPDQKERIWYERAMVYFEFAEFKRALRLLRRHQGDRERSTRVSGRLINEAQACVCEFEIERAKEAPNSHRIRKIIRKLENDIVPGLDRLAGQKTSKGARKTWPVTARLHVARMKAYLNDPTAWSHLEDAVWIRDRRLNSEMWKYSLGERSEKYKKLDAQSGWSRYTQVLLLHAKGESLRARAEAARSPSDFRKAAEFLALAARRIIQDRYKNFEYLDIVLEGL